MATFAARESGCGIFAPTAGCNQENKSTIALARPKVPLPLQLRRQKTIYLETPSSTMLSPWMNVFLVFPRKSNMTFYLLALTVFMMQWLPLLVPSLLAVQVLVYSACGLLFLSGCS